MNRNQQKYAERVKEEVEKGWCKGRIGPYERDSGEVCLRGAMLRVARQQDHFWDGIASWFAQRVKSVIQEQFEDRGPTTVFLNATTGEPVRVNRVNLSIPDFNDHDDTTKDDVLLVIEKVIADA